MRESLSGCSKSCWGRWDFGNVPGLLLRPPLNHQGHLKQANEGPLLRRLVGLVSMKGEDLMVQTSTEPQVVKFHRLRSSAPGKLRKWREVAGWRWKRSGERINLLELRAILTTLRWLVVRKGVRGRRFVHLTDSLVCLHALSRGRSSSRKLRRTISRINSLMLAADLHPIWGCIHIQVKTRLTDPVGGRCSANRESEVAP